jgi:hypothetical protein
MRASDTPPTRFSLTLDAPNEETDMTRAPRTTSDDPKDPSRQKEGPHHPEPKGWREPGGDVQEPPLPGTSGNEEKFPRKGEI